MAKGGYKGSSPARETSPEEYSGVWDIVEQYDEQSTGSWPFQEDDCAPKSCRFDEASVSHLTRTFPSAGNRRVFTWNFWVKLATLSENNIAVVGSGSPNSIRFNADGTLQIKACGGNLSTTARFRDFSAWYGITVAVDSTAAVATDRIKLFVNGEDFTSNLTGSSATLNGEANWNTAATHYIGKQEHNNSNMLDGLLSEVTFIDGQALSCEEFGFFDGQGIWQPKRFTGNYSIGGKANTTDDVYAWGLTFDNVTGGGGWYFTTEDNASSLGLTGNTGGHADELGGNTIGQRNGESTAGAWGTIASLNGYTAGQSARNMSTNTDIGTTGNPGGPISFVWNRTNGKVWVIGNGDATAIGGGDPNNSSSTPTFLLPTTGKVAFGFVSGNSNEEVTLQAINSSLFSGSHTLPKWRGVYDHTLSNNNATSTANTGGYRDVWSDELNDNSLEAVVGRNSFHLDFSKGAKDQSGRGNDFSASGIDFTETESIFSQVKYTGTNNSNPVTGTGFTPDFVWIKRMSSTSAAHSVYSSIRGVTKSFDFDNNTQEKTNDPASFVSFDADGFTVAGSHNQLNSTGSEFAAFSWKAGGATETSYSASTAAEGSIASYSSAGDYFSIVRWSGTGTNGTVKHGLNKKPKWVVVTPINADDRRRVYHEHMDPTAPHDYHANLDLDQARTGSSTAWNGAFTDKVITLGTDTNTNTTGRDYIAWCWAEQPGKSKFGVYDGDSNPVTIDVGFAPDWVIIKCVGTNGGGQEWIVKSKLYDDDEWLQAEQPYALQNNGRNITWNSNGFTVAPSNGPTNYNGRTLYIYSAFKTNSNSGDDCVDTPVNGLEASTGAAGTRRGNYCTMNPLKNSLALSDGNLKVTGTSGWKGSTGTIGMSSGSWYWEYGDVVSNEHIIGIVKTSFENPSSTVGTNDAYGYGSETGGLYDPVGGSNQSYGSSWTTGDTIGIAFDADKGNLYFYKNGTIQNSGNPAFTGLTDGPYVPSVVQNGSSRSAVLNFGQRPFKYKNAGTDRPSADYKPLATSFLPEATIKRGDEAFDIALWTGNGAAQTVRYPRLKPDLIWLKERTDTSDHGWWNTLSGVAKYLSSNLTDDEFDTTTEMNSLNEDGFTVGSSTMTNESSQDYVGWAWAAGEATTTIGVGGSNSQAFDQSQLWRDNISSSNGWNTSYPVANIFNGAFDGGGGAANNGNGGTITFTPPAAITVTKLELSCYSEVTLTLPDGTTQTIAGVGNKDQYVEAEIGTGFNFTGSNSITISRGGGFIYLERIRINGKELVDSDITINTPEASCEVRANQKAGFSIIKVASPTSTQARVHGLSKTPELIICKSTNSSDSWHTYWKLLGRGEYINLNGSSAKSSSDQFGSQEANDVSFYVKPNTGSGANKAGGMLYFAWHSVEGFSKFGEYTANNSASGPFVYCGFKPKLVLIWCHNQGEARNMFDTERHPNNFNGKFIKAGDPNQEPTGNTESFAIDILSNGFKPRGQWGGINDSNTTAKYLFAAWAEQPFQSNCRAR